MPMTREELEAAISSAVTVAISAYAVPEDTHREHHEFIKKWIAKEDQRMARNERIREKIGGWIIISILGAIGTSAWNGWQWLQAHLK